MIALILIFLIVLALVIGVIVYELLHRKKPAPSPYSEALGLLLDGHRDEAIVKLRQTVMANTQNVDAYLRLADLYYEKGELDRALQIQRALIARRGLHRDHELKIYAGLGRSYLKTGQTERAILIFEELIKLEKKNILHHETLLDLYCKAGKWEECATLLKQLSKIQNDRRRLALYFSETGRVLAHTERAAGLEYLKRALKFDPKCTAALFSLGNFFYDQSDFNQAIDYWHQILEFTPQYTFLVLDNLQRAYLDAGKFGLVIPIYEKLLKKSSPDPSLLLSLAEIYEKKGETAQAVDLLRKATEVKTGPLLPWLHLIRLQLGAGEIDKSIHDLEKLGERLEPKRFHCLVCHHQSTEFLWHCPNCHAWETFVR
jgi:pentatricopeptide repeat protein